MFKCVPCCEKLRTLEVNNDWNNNFNGMCFIENKHFPSPCKELGELNANILFSVLCGDICPYSAVGVGSS